MSSIFSIREKMGRVRGFAVFDVLGTIVFAYGLSKVIERGFVPTLAGTWVLGEAMHVAFRVKTPVTEGLGLEKTD